MTEASPLIPASTALDASAAPAEATATLMRRWMPPSCYVKGRYLSSRAPYDLCTNDAYIVSVTPIDSSRVTAVMTATGISPLFIGFRQPAEIEFNLKSSVAQLGLNATHFKLIASSSASGTIDFSVQIVALSDLGQAALRHIAVPSSRIGKLFVPHAARRIRTLEYLQRLKTSRDLKGRPLIAFETNEEFDDLDLRNVAGRIVAFVPLRPGFVKLDSDVEPLLPSIGKALTNGIGFKELLSLHQSVDYTTDRKCVPNQVLIVKSFSLHLRTMFGRVVTELLPEGVECLSANVIEPTEGEVDLQAGRTFIFHGLNSAELSCIPIEFYSLESYREHVPFDLRATLGQKCQETATVIHAFSTMPPTNHHACLFITKGEAFTSISAHDWTTADPIKIPYGDEISPRQEETERYLRQQCEYRVLSAIAVGDITSDGVLLSRYFPSPVLKSLLLSRQVSRHVKAIYFTLASRQYGSFFSQGDRNTIMDLDSFGIAVYFVDAVANRMYQFLRRRGRDCGMFVPLERIADYNAATFFGVYGSNLVAGNFEDELSRLMSGLLELKKTCDHPMLNPGQPLALLTGGGPGAMEVGNRVARKLGILSCGMFVDFGSLARKPGVTINEQKKNPYVEAFMTYRPEKLVERQSDFHLDFPVFLTGGVGTDFEYALEEVRRKVGTTPPNPLVLFGSVEHWGNKITGRFAENARSGTIKGSEWLSNVPWVVQNGAEALEVLTRFFRGTLPIGPKHPGNERGFMVASELR